MDNLKKFETQAQYEAATLSYPNVSWIVSGDTVHYVKENSTFSGLTVYYNVVDISEPTQLFNGGSGGSGSGSGGGGVLPSAMIIDGAEVEVTNSYQFSTTSEHIVQFSFEENTIPDNYFNNFENVTKVEIGDAITNINEWAFGYCSNLSSVTIGNGVTSIGGYAFGDCSGLTSITIPSSVTSIGYNAFEYCSGLTSITIPSSVTSIGQNAFGGCGSLSSITVDSGNTVYDSRNNCNAIIETSANTLIQGCNTTIIPNGVTSISEFAFAFCSGLISINIPNSVTSIGNFAFQNCSGLTSVIIGNGVTSIGTMAFGGCGSLSSITSNNYTNPSITDNTFKNIKTNGTLYVLRGSWYNTWMQNAKDYLGYYNWTKVEQ